MRANAKLYFKDGERLLDILENGESSVTEFAVVEAKLHPQTVYNAIAGKPLKGKSYRKLTKAWTRLNKSKAAG